nr:serpin family protein [Flexivirga meconopsidis]
MTPGPSATAGADLTKFGADLFLADDKISATGNGSISPYSVYSALAMTDAGARGSTSAQLDALLGGDQQRQAGNITAVDAAVAKAITNSKGAHNGPIVTQAANSLWPDKSLQVSRDFLRQLAIGYAAQVHLADYTQDAAGARDAINAWVSERTHRLIPALLGPGDVTADTRLELVNALYLKAAWAKEFKPPSAPAAFTTASGRTVQTPYLRASSKYAVARGDGWVSVSIPYIGDGMAMTVLLPDKGAFSKVRGGLAGVLREALATKPAGVVMLSLPGFALDTRSPLVPALQRLGVRALFNGADLSGIAGKPGELRVNSVAHQSVVKVDQYGTEAAAATGVGVGAVAAPGMVDRVNVDRAFFFVIHDTTTKAPLFLGQVADPTTPA